MSEKKKLTILPDKVFSCETVVNKSKFIGFAKHVCDASKASQFVAEIKKKYYDATHNCFAFVVDGATKFSDDGEPNGTAGKPILNVVSGKGICDCVVVVTRYFGGIKLGAGGLVRAYSAAAAAVLENAPLCQIAQCVDVCIRAPYAMQNAILSAANGIAHKTVCDYGQGLKVVSSVEKDNAEVLKDVVINATNGKAEIEFSQPYRALLPVKK